MTTNKMKTLKARTRVATLAMLAVMAPAAALAQDGGVIDKENADPNEVYNLPPNFDDGYKPKKTPGRVKVTIDFRDAPLNDVVKFFSSVLQRNFIISNSIQANKTITIISPKPVSQGEAYRAFLEALSMNGLTVVKAGSFYKIVDAKTAAVEPSNPILAPGKSIPNNAQMATAIIEVENTPVEEIQKIVQSFVSPNATIVTYGNQLILTDTSSNVRRMRKLVARLDTDGKAGQVYVYKVAHAEAAEIQQKLSEIFEVDGKAPQNARAKSNVKSSEGGGDELDVDVSQIIADERTNQLIIVADARSFRKISDMLELLDVPTEVGGQIHVKFLEYADAEELSGTLSTLASGSGNRSSTGNRNNARRGTVASAAASSNAQAAQLLSGEVQVTAHTPTNSLIIVASPRDYMSLERVVNLLDRPRRQVWVEAVIMEISIDQKNDTSIGFNGGLGQDFDGLVPQSAVDDGLVSSTTGLVLGQSNFGDGFTSVLGSPGGALGLLGPSLTIPGIELTIPAFAMFLQATQTDSNINVLSTPSLLALDNEESEIVVGDRVPFPQSVGGAGGVAGLAGLLGGQAGSQAAGLGGLLGGGLLNQVTYEDVGITLRIKPQVNESKYVRLEVDQEVSSVGAPTDLGPTRSKRSIKTIVLVKDQSTVVIGGLIRDDENESETKVPFLGDIPLIGLLFRTTNTVKTKQNLVLMLTPYIIESEADLKKIHERKRKERAELLQLFQRRDSDFMSRIDYAKKPGLVDRMRKNIGQAKLEEGARRSAREAFEQTGPRYQILGTTPKPAADGEKKPGAAPVTKDGE